MLLVAPVKKERCIPMTDEQHELWGIDKLNVPRSDLPAITHIDYSARVQTVTRKRTGDYYDLIKAFERRTGCAGGGQHLVQRARRADRLHAGGRLPVLHADPHRRARAGAVRARKARATRVEGDGEWQQEFQLD